MTFEVCSRATTSSFLPISSLIVPCIEFSIESSFRNRKGCGWLIFVQIAEESVPPAQNLIAKRVVVE